MGRINPKGQNLFQMKRPLHPKIKVMSDILVAICLGSIWGGLVKLRDSIMTLFCAETQTGNLGSVACSPNLVNPMDRWVIGMKYDSTIDGLSFFTQYFAGFAVLFLLLYVTFFSKKKSPISLFQLAIIFLHITLINGVIMETVRLLVQRPRPWLYDNIAGFGSQTANYTSFYSGHTSFAALSASVFYFISRSQKPSGLKGRDWVFPVFMFINAILTGFFRVFANRHFPSDVIAGLFVGMGIAWSYWNIRFRRIVPFK